jgi:glyoxylase-like metal-dependent hydrolase (beta-lactamase superfamily II)
VAKPSSCPSRRWIATVFAFAIAAVSLSAQAPAQRDPIVREGVTEKIADHTWVIPDGNVVLVPNVGIVVGSRGMLVIDTGMGVRNGATVLEEARKIRPEGTLYLATTHIHPEHDLGAGAFPRETIFIRSEDQEKEIAETGLTTANLFAGRSPVMADLLKDAKFRQANITFSKEHVVDLGGVRVRLIAMGMNHTRGDTAFLVEPDHVLFAGDLVMRAQPGLNQQSTIAHWLQSLDTLEALHPARIVPSHGPMGDASMIANYRTYLQTIQTRVAALKRDGKNIEEAAQTIATELQPQYPDRNRTMAAVRVAYNQR